MKRKTFEQPKAYYTWEAKPKSRNSSVTFKGKGNIKSKLRKSDQYITPDSDCYDGAN